MPESVSNSPFQKLDLSDGLGAKRNAFLHFFGGEFITDSAVAIEFNSS
jgi:hypothetical protein